MGMGYNSFELEWCLLGFVSDLVLPVDRHKSFLLSSLGRLALRAGGGEEGALAESQRDRSCRRGSGSGTAEHGCVKPLLSTKRERDRTPYIRNRYKTLCGLGLEKTKGVFLF
ncbi:APC_CDC26 superfamily domain-containing protein [Histoplasma ohiense]|nr:APC_CDC26 superfamily domain-containing protein [Histoplasma ohiense (nom. inval.)]